MMLDKKKTRRSLAVVIMAAGKGKRMKSNLPKVLHPVGAKPMILRVIEVAMFLKPDRVIVILGVGKEKVITTIKGTGIEHVVQEEQLGTGHAVQQVEPLLGNFNGDILILSGDVPLLRYSTLKQLLATHHSASAGATLLTAIFENPSGYGRIVRKPDNTLDHIVEHKDCSTVQLDIKEINAGVYVFDAQTLFTALKMINNNNQQREYYLPDVLDYFPQFGKKVALQVVMDSEEIAGINTKEQLVEINRIFEVRYGHDN